MTTPPFDVSAYCARIGAPLPARPTESALRSLHVAHAFSVPFENLDVLLSRPIHLDVAHLFAKIVHHERGGYCHEVNTLLRHALRATGFEVRPLLARVRYARPEDAEPGPRTHTVLLVTVERRLWLADVGFGGPGLRAPIPLEPGREVQEFSEAHRLIEHPKLGFVLQKKSRDGVWQDLYSFDLQPVYDGDIALANFFSAMAPESRFRQGLVCSIAAPWGRVTLEGRTLTEVRHGAATARDLTGADDLSATLEACFAIPPNAAFGGLL